MHDAEAVERIMKAADGFTGFVPRGGDVSALPVLLSGARVFCAAASGKDDYNDDEILIEEDFTVWRDSERCSSVLLGIYLGESLGESF